MSLQNSINFIDTQIATLVSKLSDTSTPNKDNIQNQLTNMNEVRNHLVNYQKQSRELTEFLIGRLRGDI